MNISDFFLRRPKALPAPEPVESFKNLADFMLARAWNSQVDPADIFTGPGLVSKEECNLLYSLAKDYYTGAGSIVDLGCYLGRSTKCLGTGLLANTAVPNKTSRIYSYDRFSAQEQYLEDYVRNHVRFRLEDLMRPEGMWFRPIFDETIQPFADSVQVFEGEFPPLPYDGGPVELLFIDLSKTEALNTAIIEVMFPHLIPGKSVVIHQDFHHIYAWWIYFSMDFFSDYFRVIVDGVRESCVFLLVKEIPEEKIAEFAAVSISQRYSYEAGLASMTRMQEQLAPPYRGFIELNKIRWKIQFGADLGATIEELKQLPLDWINQRDHWAILVNAIDAEIKARAGA